MMPDLTLYDFELDEDCYKVRLLLSMLGLEWKGVMVNVFPGREHERPPYIELNPSGRLPILKDGDFVLSGAEAILVYVARSHGGDRGWLPDDRQDFGRVLQWLGFATVDLAAAAAARQISLFDAPGDRDALQAKAQRALRIMDDHMTMRQADGHEWFAASHPTLADVALFPAFGLSHDFGIEHGEFAALRRWARRVRAIDGFITMPGIPAYS